MLQAAIVKGRDLDGKERVLQKTKPQQLELFHHLLPEKEGYSNTIELYDAIPRYFASPKKMAALREAGKFLNTLERQFVYKNNTYQLEIHPGRIKDSSGNFIEYYPSEREQFVEEALWKIAHDKARGCYLDDMVGVEFSLNELRQELARRGHSIQYGALIDALSILNRCNITLKDREGKAVLSSPIYPQLLISNRGDWQKDPKNTKCYVQFNKLATRSLSEMDYRLFDYHMFMSIDSFVARWIYKRLSHNFTQAGLNSTYSIKASSIVRDSGLIGLERFTEQLRSIERSLKELQKRGVIRSFAKKKIPDREDRRKIIDAIYDITTSYQFSQVAIIANQHSQQLHRVGNIRSLA